MIDLNILRTEPDRIRKALASRNSTFDLEGFLALDKKRREGIGELEKLQQEKNTLNEEISRLLGAKSDAKPVIQQMKAISHKIAELSPKVESINQDVGNKALFIPNLPHSECPVGKDSAANKQVRKHDTQNKPEKPKSHIELAEDLGLVDFKRSPKLSGSSFVLFTGDGARLERALINFMLDTHTGSNGYREVSPPFLVKRHCMEGTGQLPKFEEDMYRIYRGSKELENGPALDSDLFLIPTAEVPVTNIHRDEIIKEEDLPLSYAAYTPCFRLEAGAYGQDTKGMIRVHQFDKVELVKIVHPDASYQEHEKLTRDATGIFELLEIPYRVMLLATGDMGFAAAKCYDIEVWAPGTGRWLEASSCSNFEEFQARRAGIKFKDKKTQKTRYAHTLNGSGVALARTFIALLENHQQADGSIKIPEALRPYMGGKTHLKKPAAR